MVPPRVGRERSTVVDVWGLPSTEETAMSIDDPINPAEQAVLDSLEPDEYRLFLGAHMVVTSFARYPTGTIQLTIKPKKEE